MTPTGNGSRNRSGVRGGKKQKEIIEQNKVSKQSKRKRDLHKKTKTKNNKKTKKNNPDEMWSRNNKITELLRELSQQNLPLVLNHPHNSLSPSRVSE